MTSYRPHLVWRPARAFWLALALTLTFVPAAVAVVYGIQDETTRILANDVLFPFYGFLITGIFGVAAWRSGQHSHPLGIAWWVLMAAQLLWTLGDLTWGILEAGLKIQPFPSLADGFYLSYYGVFLAGVLLLPSERRSTLDRVKRLLDAMLVFLAASGIFWVFWLGPYAQSLDTSDPVTLFFSLAYPVGDMVLIWSTTTLLLRPLRAQPRWPLVLLGLSAVAGAAADVAYTHQTINNTYVSGSLIDLGWMVVMVLSLWAAALQAAAPVELLKHTTRAADVPEPAWFKYGRRALPYAAIVGAFGLLYWVRNAEDLALAQPEVIERAVAALVLLVLVRQLLTLIENARLSVKLQAELKERREVEATLRNEIAERRRVEEALRESQERLLHDAVHDSLTGLPNRTLFMDRLERAVERGKRKPNQRFAVLFLDFDGFKYVNDSLGHPLGDQLLVLAAGRLQSCVRSSDTLARLGGDEFVMLLDDLQVVSDATEIAERTLGVLKQPFDLDGHSLTLSASIGVVFSGAGLLQADDILRDADIAMYQAKQAGKARYAVFDAGMGAKALARMDLERELRGAIERQELRLQYQPIIDTRTRQLIGFEALLRWRHPRLGNIPPGDFIPIAEETGLIVAIGQMVLWEACRQMVAWQRTLPCADPVCTISINLSTRQFRQPDLVEQVQQALHETGLAAACLNLEVTESVIIGDAAAAVATLRNLRALGVNLHIDDFGTGYSSLSYLHQFPIDTLKIDRAFIAGLDRDGRTRRLVDNIVTLAHDLGLKVVAEGVETLEQVALIDEIGCEQMQGYVFSRPLEAAGVPEFVSRFARHHTAPLDAGRL